MLAYHEVIFVHVNLARIFRMPVLWAAVGLRFRIVIAQYTLATILGSEYRMPVLWAGVAPN